MIGFDTAENELSIVWSSGWKIGVKYGAVLRSMSRHPELCSPAAEWIVIILIFIPARALEAAWARHPSLQWITTLPSWRRCEEQRSVTCQLATLKIDLLDFRADLFHMFSWNASWSTTLIDFHSCRLCQSYQACLWSKSERCTSMRTISELS